MRNKNLPAKWRSGKHILYTLQKPKNGKTWLLVIDKDEDEKGEFLNVRGACNAKSIKVTANRTYVKVKDNLNEPLKSLYQYIMEAYAES